MNGCMHCVRLKVLMDVYDNEREINRLADMLVEYELEELRLMCAAGVDAVQFGDDFGTARAMLFSPEVWRSFFKPRYRRLVQFAREQGKAVFFHSCGYAAPILEDLREIGVNAVWPQLTAYDMEELAARLRRLGLASRYVDRANVMTHGTPADVTRPCMRQQGVDVMNGGAYFYVETDNGFRWKISVPCWKPLEHTGKRPEGNGTQRRFCAHDAP
ncbi:MAG: uroporphyrinogen decarboxylase family protein [Ruthenibacterium lactatiformans]